MTSSIKSINRIKAGLLLISMLLINSMTFAGNDGRKSEAKTKVFPQPGIEVINIEFSVDKASMVTFQLCTMTGEVVQTINVACDYAGLYNQSIQVRGLPQGPYLLLEHDGSRRQTGQIVVIGP